MTDRQAPIPVEADTALATLTAALDKLAALVAEETEHARTGRVRAAVALEPKKAALAQDYLAAAARVKAAQAVLSQSRPQALEAVRQRHEEFEKALKTNMTVLATAHAVGEGIVRGVSAEMARRAAPSTYGASGRTNKPNPRAAGPIAVSRAI